MPADSASPAASGSSVSSRSVGGTRRRWPLLAGGVAAWWAGRGLLRAITGVPTAMGASRKVTQPKLADAPQFADGKFQNRLPVVTMAPGSGPTMLKQLLTKRGSGKPQGVIPLWTEPAPAGSAALAVTWFGHASVLVEIDGFRVLADPVWGERVSPSALVGPKRLHPMPIGLDQLPTLDAVIISHDHYDHLDLPTIQYLVEHQSMPFVVPRGVGEHLRRWKVPEDRIVELDWDGSHTIGTLKLTCTEAQHFSGRGLTRDDTLWASWVIAGYTHRVFFGGDTGYTPAFADLGRQYGPFDLSLLPIGAYGDQWASIHLNPEEAVATHADISGGVFVPIHWASFDLAFHAWVEPIERLLAAADEHGVTLATPMPGQRVVVGEELPVEPWWKAVSGG